MFSSSRHILILGLTLTFAFGLKAEDESAGPELPEYCADYPVIERELEDYRNSLSSREGEVSHTLCHKDQNFSVGVSDILTHWSDVQEAQYDDQLQAFEEKLRKKVFKNLAMSTYFYRDIYGPNCQELELSSGPDGDMQRSQCFEQWGVAPNCNNQEYQEIFEEVDNDYATYREQEALELTDDEDEDEDEDEDRDQALTQAYEDLDEEKKSNFIKTHIENTFRLSSLTQELQEMQQANESDEQLNTQEAEYNQRLAQIYHQTPLLFESEDQLPSADFEKSDYAHQLEEKFISAKPEVNEMSVEDIDDFLATEEGQEVLANIASDNDLESIVEEALAREIRKKRGLLEDVCKGDVENLHRFPSLVEQVMSESIESGEASEVVADQAAYCYMLQAIPTEDEGEEGTSFMAKAFNFMRGSFFVNPVVNPLMSLASGYMMNASGQEETDESGVEGYFSDVQQFSSTEEAYHSSTSWGADSDEASAAEEVDIPEIKIRIVGQEGDHIEVEGDQAEFEVEAYFEDESREVPPGSFKWECIPPDGEGNENLCEDSGYSESGKSQSVKLFNRVPYILKASYGVEDGYFPLYLPPAPLSVTLEMKCETNETGAQCVSDDDPREVASTDEDDVELERIREPFWWESLPPNAPPPQFKPGPPMQMRTFILPGAV